MGGNKDKRRCPLCLGTGHFYKTCHLNTDYMEKAS